MSFSGEFASQTCLRALLLLVLASFSMSRSLVVETLPGYSGKLPFKLETGYVGVGETEDIQLFYYFIQSERSPVKDPLVLWLTGGPGCSALSGLAFEIGPFSFNSQDFDGSLPTLTLNPHSWTKVANVLFLDAPVGSGFSYSNSSEGYYTSDTLSAETTYNFLQKWLLENPKYLKNPLYIAGDSYSGILVPMITLKISDGIKNGSLPNMKLQGYMLGNPVTDSHKDDNAIIPYAHRVALLSDELYESAKANCDGEYVYPDEDNVECIDDLLLISECIGKVNNAHILEPKCSFAFPSTNESHWGQKKIEDIFIDDFHSITKHKELWCRNKNYVPTYIWANNEYVQEALHVRNGTISDWKRCNKSLDYDHNIESVVEYHRNLTKRGLRALIYSGDHDMMIPYLGTHTWVASLNVTIIDDWRPWFVDGQIAGFTEKYGDLTFELTFATVKGGGHTAPEYKPKQCLKMVDRWFSYYIL